MTIKIRAPLLTAIGALAAPGLWAQDDAAEQDSFDRAPQDCISTSRIDRTEVLDNRTILFHMSGRRVYRNYLPRNCPGLEREGRFMYEITGNRLCDIDRITVLEQFGGRLDRGFTCPLGSFHPVSEEEIEELRLLAESGVDGNVDVEAVELPDEGADTGSAAGEPPAEDSDEN
jgi:hypothetical protein